jgi:hypothetical protein
MRTYQITKGEALWHINEQKFSREEDAIAYVRKLEGSEGKVVRTKDRIEIQFNDKES